MPLTDKDILGTTRKRELVEATPPGSEQKVFLRYPAFAEWHELMVEHAKCERASEPPPASLIIKTLAYTIADADGNRRLSNKEAEVFLNADPEAVMGIYRKAGQTVLKHDNKVVGDLEGNSAASREG